MATSPIFTVPRSTQARVAAANTASDGSGTLVDLWTAPATGSLVERIKYANSQATAAASSAMVIRVFETDNANANPRLLAEVAVPAATRTTAVVGASGTIEFPNGKGLVSGQHLKVIQSVYAGAQDQMDFICEGGDF